MSTYNRLDLQTLGSQPVIMPKNLPITVPDSSVGPGGPGKDLRTQLCINRSGPLHTRD